MTVHGLLAAALAGIPVRIAEEVGTPNRGRVGRLVFPLLYQLATAVIGVSQSTVDFLTVSDGVPPSKALLVHNAIDDRYFQMQPRSGGCGGRTILAVGRLVPVKAHDVLVRAAAPLLRGDDQLVVLIAGEGPERTRIEALAHKLGVGSSVHLLGHRTDVDKLLATADAYVLCSHSEGLPLSLVEAMAARVPVIATAVGGVAEVVPPDAVSRLIAPGDVTGLREAIRQVLSLDARERDAILDRFRKHASRHFRSSRYVTDLTNIYSDQLTRARLSSRQKGLD